MKKSIYYKKQENVSQKTQLEFINEKYNESISKINQLQIKKQDILKIQDMLMTLKSQDQFNPYLQNQIFKLKSKINNYDIPELDMT